MRCQFWGTHALSVLGTMSYTVIKLKSPPSGVRILNCHTFVYRASAQGLLCSRVCSESFRTVDTKNAIFVSLFLTMFYFFIFPEQKERRRIRQGIYIAEEALNLSNYEYRRKKFSVPSCATYGAG